MRGPLKARITWIPATILGAALFGFLGLITAFILGIPGFIPLEVIWAFVTGTGIAIFQSPVLNSSIVMDMKRNERKD